MFKQIPLLNRISFTRRNAFTLPTLFLLIEFFDELHYAIDGAVLPAIRADLSLSYAEIGLLLGLPHIFGTLIEPGLMLLGDTQLRKRLVILGGIAIAFALLAISTTGAFIQLLLALMINFPASGAFVSLSQATLMDLNPGREAQMMARWTIAGSVGNLIGPLIVAGGLSLALGWRWVFIFLAVLVAILILLLIPQHFPKPINPKPDDIHLKSLISNLWQALRNRRLLRWMSLLEMSDLLLDVFAGYLALYFTDIAGATPAQASLVLSLLMLASLAADLLLIPILERIDGRRLVRWTAVFAVLVYTSWLLAPWFWVKIGLLIAIRLTTMGWYQVLQGEAYAAVPGRSGTVLAINSVSGLAGGAMIWLIGWFAGWAGLAAAMWLLLLGPVFLALFTPKPEDAPLQQ